jgi:UDP-hydrolysing UDP-N-acetyl-D-glucosamine 2-epimerase
MSVGVTSILDNQSRHFALEIFNRATYSRCKHLIKAICEHPNMKLDLILSSSLGMEEYGSPQKYIERENPKANIHHIPIEFAEGAQRAGQASAAILDGFTRFLLGRSYTAFIVVADRFETLPAAFAANLHNIPVVHLQGGEVTGNIDERVRHAVTKLSDYHFAATECAKKYIIEMGEERFRVFSTGCPSLDVVRRGHIRRYAPKEKYIICQFHPHTTEVDEAYEQTAQLLDAVVEYCAKEGVVCYWYWPNPDPGREEVIRLIEEAHKKNKMWLIKAMNKPPEQFLLQLSGAKFIIGNSSCGIRECSFMGVPAINVGDRQALRERSWNVIDCGFGKEELLKAIYVQHHAKKYPRSLLYGDGRASEYMLAHLAHIDFELKGQLTYPMKFEFRELHFGEARFERHKKHQRTARHQDKTAV